MQQKLNPEFKERFIEALLSGKYKQDKGRLRTSIGYCCLGVLCDLFDPDKWHIVGNINLAEPGAAKGLYHFDDMSCFLPKFILAELGITPYDNFTDDIAIYFTHDEYKALPIKVNSDTGVLIGVKAGDYYKIGLSYLNDAGYTFEEIAEFVRKHL